MSYEFDGVNDVLNVASNVGITAFPFTIFAWVKKPTAHDGSVIRIAHLAMSVQDDHRWGMDISFSAHFLLSAYRNISSPVSPSTSDPDTLGLDTWKPCLVEYVSNINKRVYLNDVAGSLDNENKTFTSQASHRFGIGALYRLSPLYGKGRIAEVAVWTAQLTSQARADLAAGKSPGLVQTGDLTAYWKLTETGGLTDQVGTNDLTNTGGATALSDHPTIDYGTTRYWTLPTTAANDIVRTMVIFSDDMTTVLDSGEVTAAGGFFQLAAANQGIALGTRHLAVIHNWDENPNSLSIRGGPGIVEMAT